MARIMIEEDGNMAEAEGECVVAFVFDSEEEEEGVRAMIIGYGNSHSILTRCSLALGAMVREKIKDEILRGLLGLMMIKKMKAGMAGKEYSVKAVKDSPDQDWTEVFDDRNTGRSDN